MRIALFAKRLVVVATSAVLALALLTGGLAALALNADWDVPDRRALESPSVLLDRNGLVLARFTSAQDRRPVDLDQVSEAAVDAVIASEDVRFYEHTGVDVVSLLRAVYRNVRTGGIEQGGSTLTQQFVKNALEGIGTERTIIRKVREAVVSIALERRLVDELGSSRAAKDQVLEDYLNVVFFGEGAYGIEAASREFFGIPASRLTAGQGALLAQALPAPSVRNPRVDPEGAAQRRDRILATMLEVGMIDRETHDLEAGRPVEVVPRRPAEFVHPYFVEYARKQLVAAYGEDAVLTGGLTVRTTLDRRVQRALDAAVAEVLPPQEGENADVAAAAVAIDPRTGEVLGIHGGRDFAEQQQDLATQGRRQNGSTFKPFGFIAALEAGRSPDAFVPTPGRQVIRPEDCKGPLGEPWEVSGPGGSMRLRDALMRSVNTAFQGLACDLGPEAILDVARRMGVANVIDPVPSVGLGGAAFGASVLDLASAYATLANDGLHCPARTLLEVTDAAGATLQRFDEVTVVPQMEQVVRRPPPGLLAARADELEERDRGGCVQAIDPDHARVTTEVLADVVERTTGRRAQIDRPQAGKTGTTNDESDAWFVGYTPDLAIAVWVGHTTSNDPLRDVEGFAKVQGGTIPALIWKAAAERILEGTPATEFPGVGEDLDARGRAPAPERPREEPTDGADGGGGDGPDGEGGDPGDGGGDGGEPSPEPSESESEPCIIVIGNCS